MTFRAFLRLAFLVISLVWCSEPLFLLGIHNYYLRFGVQSHFHISTFIAVVLVWHSEPWFRLTFRVVIVFPFGVLSHIFCFGVQSHSSFSFWRSEPLFIFLLPFKATFSFRCSERSFIFRLAFRVIVRFPFGVQSRSSSSVWCSESLIIFVRRSDSCRHLGVQSRIVILAFRVVSSVWHLESYLQFGIQSCCLSLVRYLEPFSDWCSESLFPLVRYSELHLQFNV